MAHTWHTARSEGKLTSTGARGTLPRDAWPCLGQGAGSVEQEMARGPGSRESPGGGGDNGDYSVDKQSLRPQSLLRGSGSSQTSLSPPARPFPLPLGFYLTSQEQLGPGKEMPRVGPNGDAGPGAIRPSRPAGLAWGYSSPVGRQPGTS